ncbi:zinc-binding alcohol dehydrogenase family protein [Aspergillus aculeatinus CBS 121060]|uniref:GroES-like protein n=1 Tax=Aspergillus aculeatinus CBS 121060 TaxID=1448322 RepID=A0ACD1H2U7_9EURO|nr:GroES-like protein [Aspergillus aculeatinus CBS 121060]RAH67864.1 GroES-like protein [Aspergillus aculeatinus CBS 121060]
MSQQTQTALLVTEIGKPLTKGTRPIPEPQENQVLVKITVAGLNPHDAKSRDYGLFIQESLPAVLAADVVGVVTRLGPNVTRYQEGDHIVGQAGLTLANSNDTAGLQEYAILDARYSAKVPAGFTDAQLATLPTNLVAPAVALFDASALGIPAPWTTTSSDFDHHATSLLIIGGGSNTGRFGIQLAALAGLGRIIVVGSARSAAEAQRLGATHVIDRADKSGAEIAAEVRAIVGDDLLYVYDAINPPENQYIGVEALSNTHKGKLARLLPTGPVDESRLSAPKPAGFETLNVFGLSAVRPATAAPLWEHVTEWVQAGKLVPTESSVIEGLDVDAVNRTLDGYSNGSVSGHWQIRF